MSREKAIKLVPIEKGSRRRPPRYIQMNTVYFTQILYTYKRVRINLIFYTANTYT